MKRGFVIHHNGPTANCVGASHERCKRFWAAVCRYHGQRWGSYWASTSVYSFGVCPHGVRFTGRGWHRSQAANGSDAVGSYDGKDSEWYTVLVFLGGSEQPTAEMVEATRALISEGRNRGLCGTRVLPHNDFKRKACPGPEFTALARQWDNASLTGPSPEEDMDPRTLVVLIYMAVLGRKPESLAVIQGGVDYIQQHGQNAYLQMVLDSDEAKERWG